MQRSKRGKLYTLELRSVFASCVLIRSKNHPFEVRCAQELRVITTDGKAPVLYLILEQQVLHLPTFPGILSSDEAHYYISRMMNPE